MVNILQCISTRVGACASRDMLISGYGRWSRTFPHRIVTIKKNKDIYFRKISDSISLIAINSFTIDKKATIDSLISTHSKTIQNSRYLLIDLRNNSGGHSMTYDTLLPLLYTKPIITDGFVVKSSVDNIEIYRKLAGSSEYSEEVKDAFKSMILKMEKSIDSLVIIGGIDTVIYPSVIENPKKIGIIVNEGTVSAAELFLLLAKQSDKVTIFGSHTRGALDYTELGDTRILPCPYIGFLCPMGMSQHKVYPYIDNVGIKPDVEIPDGVANWVDFVIKQYSIHKW